MTDILKINDAIDNSDISMSFGSTRVGRFLKDPYTGRAVDLLKDRETALHDKRHLENPNVINFDNYMESYLSTKENRERYQYFMEVPFPNPNLGLFSNLYKKFGGIETINRHWFRVDVYFPELGIAVELDSEEYHGDAETALDNAKENLIYEYYGIPTILRLNLASTKEWENKRRFRSLTAILDKADVVKNPVVLYNTLLDSWNIKNEEVLDLFPYVESCISNYYTKHDNLYKQRDVYLDPSKIKDEAIKIKLSRGSIITALKNVYKRVKNINLVVVGA